jgi:hypothetical protein
MDVGIGNCCWKITLLVGLGTSHPHLFSGVLEVYQSYEYMKSVIGANPVTNKISTQ